MSNEKNTVTRQPYHKPRLRVVELAAREVLGKGCKTDSSSSSVGNGGACGTDPGAPLLPCVGSDIS